MSIPLMNNLAATERPDEIDGDVPLGLHYLQTLSGHRNVIYECAWSPRGRVLVSVAADRTICRWDLQKGKPVQSTQAFYDFLFGVAWSPNGRYLATASFDKTVRVIYAGSGKQARSLSGHKGPVFGVAWSRTSRFLASASDDNTVRLWDSEKRWRSQVLEGHEDWVLSVAWSFQEHLLASGSRDQTVRVWDRREKSPRFVLKGHSDIVNCVAWSPNGRYLASASDDGEVRIWNSETQRQVIVLSSHRAAVLSVRFSPDGRLLASKSSDGTVQLWDSHRWQLVAVLAESIRSDLCNGLSFHPNKHQLATLSHDQKSVRIWQLDYGILLGDMPDVRHIQSMICSSCSELIPASMVSNRLKRGRDMLTCPVCDTVMSLTGRAEDLAQNKKQIALKQVADAESGQSVVQQQADMMPSEPLAVQINEEEIIVSEVPQEQIPEHDLAHKGKIEETVVDELEPITKLLKEPDAGTSPDASEQEEQGIDPATEPITKVLKEVEEKTAASETETAVPPVTE